MASTSALMTLLLMLFISGSLWTSSLAGPGKGEKADKGDKGGDDYYPKKKSPSPPYYYPSPSDDNCPPPPPPPPDCSKCSCVCQSCPICKSCPPPPHKECPHCPPPKECPYCPPPKPCPPPTPCSNKPKECHDKDKGCSSGEYPPSSYADKTDASLVNGLLSVEYALNGFYKNAASGSFKDETVTKLVGDFKAQTDSHIKALSGMLKEQAVSEPAMNLNRTVFSNLMSLATGKQSTFDAYASGTNSLLAASTLAPLASGVSTSVLAKLQGDAARTLLAGVSSSLAGQTGAVDAMLLQRAADKVSQELNAGEAHQKLAASLQAAAASSPNSTGAPVEVSAVQLSGTASTLDAEQALAALKKLGIFT